MIQHISALAQSFIRLITDDTNHKSQITKYCILLDEISQVDSPLLGERNYIQYTFTC